MACSPGGRFLRFRAILTPFPFFPSDNVAVPTSLPFASFIATVTGAFAASRAAPEKKNIAGRASIRLVTLNSNLLQDLVGKHWNCMTHGLLSAMLQDTLLRDDMA